MSRILVDLAPFEDALETRAVTREQYVAFVGANPDLRVERLASGEMVVMPPASSRTSAQNAEIVAQLRNWAVADGTGISFGPDAGYDLPNGANRGPDASWVGKARIAALSADEREPFFALCPDFVIELRSPSDRVRTSRDKMREYMENGCRLGWLIDPKTRTVYVYRPGMDEQVVENADTISADPELPGFRLDLARVWDPGI